MLKKFRRLPSPALVVSVIALGAAVGGTAVALPGKNTVDKNDIRKNAVKSRHVKNNSLTGGDIREGTLGRVPSATDAAQLDGKPADRVLRWLRVVDGSGDPAIAASSHSGFTVEDPNGDTDGLSRITAPDAVNDCAVLATGGLNSAILAPGVLSANALQFGVATYDGSPETIQVTAENDTGGAVDAGYFLAILC